MKLTDQKKQYLAQKAFEGIAKAPIRDMQNRLEQVTYDIRKEFQAFMQHKVDKIKVDSALHELNYVSDYTRTLSVPETAQHVTSYVRIFGTACYVKDTSPAELPAVPQQEVLIYVGNSGISQIPMRYISSELTAKAEALCAEIQEHNTTISQLAETVKKPLYTSDTLAKLLEVWPSAKMLVPREWYREEEARKDKERERRAQLKRERILREQKAALKLEEERAEMSDIDTALLTARMQGDIS